MKLEGRGAKNDDRISILGVLEDSGSINQEVKISTMRRFSKRICHFCESLLCHYAIDVFLRKRALK